MAPSKQTSGWAAAAALLACCFIHGSAAHALERRASECYGELGCFSTVGNFLSLPQKPSEIATTFTLMVRGNTKAAVLRAIDDPDSWHSALAGSGFSAAKETKFITHGYIDSASAGWNGRMASELLKKVSQVLTVSSISL